MSQIYHNMFNIYDRMEMKISWSHIYPNPISYITFVETFAETEYPVLRHIYIITHTTSKITKEPKWDGQQ